jgi:hypothetical protein
MVRLYADRIRRLLNSSETKRADAEAKLADADSKLAEREVKLEESERVIAALQAGW